MRTVCAMLLALFICLLVLRNCAAVKRKERGRGDRDKSAVDDAIYDVMIRMIEGERLPAVNDRTRAQRSAAVRYWRAHGDLSVKEEGSCKFIYSKATGHRMLRVSEVQKVISDEYKRVKKYEYKGVKGSGAAKLVASLKENFAGLSRIKVQEFLNTDKQHYKRNA